MTVSGFTIPRAFRTAGANRYNAEKIKRSAVLMVSGLSAMTVSYLTAWRLTDERLCDFIVVRRRCLPSGEAAVRGRACCSSYAEITLSADRNERRLELEEFHGGLKSIRARSENAPTKILAAQRDRR